MIRIAPVVCAALLALTLSPVARAQDADGDSCTLVSLRSVAGSSWWTELGPACESLDAIGPATFDPPATIPGPVWDGAIAQCRRGAGARFLCDAAEPVRVEWMTAIRTALSDIATRAGQARASCAELDALAPWAETAPEADRAAYVAAIAAVRALCADRAARVPTADDLARIVRIRQVSLRARARGATPEAGVVLPEWTSASSPAATSGHGGDGRASGSVGGLERGAESAAMGPVGLVDVAVQGLTQLLIGRAQAELEAYALGELRRTLCAPRARPWFEHTCSLLEGEPGSLRLSLGAGLRAAFQRDVLALPEHALALAPREGGVRELAFRLFFELTVGFLDVVDPADTAARAAEVGAAFRCDEAGEARARCERGKLATIGAGLTLATMLDRPAISDLPDPLLASFVATMVGHDLEVRARTAIGDVRDAVRRLRRVTSRATRRRGADAVLARAGQAARATVTALDSVLAVAGVHGEVSVRLPDGADAIVVAVDRGDLAAVAVETTRVIAKLGARIGLPGDVARGLVLAAEIATAESPEQVRDALDSVIAPVGAWRLKRERSMVSLTGLVGAGGGAEWLAGSGLSSPDPAGAAMLVGAVGVDVSFPVGTSTLGLFLAIIDVGGLMSLPIGDVTATVRAPDGTTHSATLDVEPHVSAAQILSPGLYLRWGLPNMPLVLGAGASIVPLGRTVVEQSAGADRYEHDVSVIRVGGFLAVDVTLLPF